MKKDKKTLIIGGTSESRDMIRYLNKYYGSIYVSVATEYGKSLISENKNTLVYVQRLNKDEFVEFIRRIDPDIVIDATHPYANIVTQNVKGACIETSTKYIRLVRPRASEGDFIWLKNIEEAVLYLNSSKDKAFITCGSKEIEKFIGVSNYKERLYIRILPMVESIYKCNELGFDMNKIIGMQGPFSMDMNLAMFKNSGANILISKDSGKVGGFNEKIQAALALGMKILIIGREVEEEGLKYKEIIDFIDTNFIKKKEEVEYTPYFPLFISLKDKLVKVFGGGKIATRRVNSMIQFASSVEVVSPIISDELKNLKQKGLIKVIERNYKEKDIHGASLVLAITNDKLVNKEIGEECRRLNIPVSVADDKRLSTFYFPGTVVKDNLVIGVTASGQNHKQVKEVTKELRNYFKLK